MITAIIQSPLVLPLQISDTGIKEREEVSPLFWMIVIPFVLVTMTLAMLVHTILEKYYALLFTDKTDYAFKCSACQTEYQLSGDEVKKHIHPKWLFLTKKKKYRFTCPNCQTKAVQEKRQTTYH